MGTSFSSIDSHLQQHLKSKDFPSLRTDAKEMSELKNLVVSDEDHKHFRNILSSILSSKDIIVDHPDIGALYLTGCVVHFHENKFHSFYKTLESFRPLLESIKSMITLVTADFASKDVEGQLGILEESKTGPTAATRLGLIEPALSIILLAMEGSTTPPREWISAVLPILFIGSALIDPSSPVSPFKRQLGDAVGTQLDTVKKLIAKADSYLNTVDNESRKEIQNFEEGKYWTAISLFCRDKGLNTNKAVALVDLVGKGKTVQADADIWKGHEDQKKAIEDNLQDKLRREKERQEESDREDASLQSLQTSINRIQGGGVMAAYEVAKFKAFGVPK